MKPLLHLLAGFALLLPLAAGAATLSPYPSDKTCEDERNRSYAEGFAAGDTNGFNRGYPIGYGDGSAAQIAKCVADPHGCGITLASCIPSATYGETEPNDNFITADPLTLSVNFWAQLYSAADQDWFYTATTSPNQNLLLNFSIPDWIDLSQYGSLVSAPIAWNISVRDAAGNIFANFNTNVVGAIQATSHSVTYSVTLGLVGTYYIVVQPIDKTTANAYPYAVAAFLQDSSLVNDQPIVGFYDSEIEPNNVPSRSNPLATGVSMYGLINLTFNSVVTDPDDDSSSVWAQGENDWFVYKTDGNELVTLNFCAREKCGPGNWFVEVYDQAMAQRWESGESPTNLTPLLAFNTDTTNDPTATFRIGLKDPGYYFMRVYHKRLFTAPCNEYRYVTEDGFDGLCTCDTEQASDVSTTGNACYIPTDACIDEELGLLCRTAAEECTVGSDPGCFYNESSPPGCVTTKPGEDDEVCSTYVTQARCSCSIYGGVVQIPDNAYTSPYNFTWHGTKLPTNTIDTDAYEDYLDRPNPYTP